MKKRKSNRLIAYVMALLLFFEVFTSGLAVFPDGTAHAAGLTPPALTVLGTGISGEAIAPDTAHDVELNFPDTTQNQSWCGVINAVYGDGTTLNASDYTKSCKAQNGNKPYIMIKAGTLQAGTHNIKVSANGYEDATVSVSIAEAARIVSKKLKNGSFEEPPFGTSGPPGDNKTWDYIRDDDSLMSGWQTTASDHYIEYRKDSTASAPIPEGNQFAELNAQKVSTLYQDIETIPGTTVYWRLYHRGRNGEDTMELRIGAPDGTLASQGTMTDGNTAWRKYTGSYVVPAGQTVTRFAFASVKAFNNKDNEGNFLDDIFFGVGPHVVVTESINSQLTSGDIITYEVKVINDGGDVASGTFLTNPLPEGTVYVPGSLQIMSGPNSGPMTDMAGDDQGEYDSQNNRIVVRLGDEATASNGGRLANTEVLPEGTTVRYQVRIASANAVTNGKQKVEYDNLLIVPEEHLTATANLPLTASNITTNKATLSWPSVTDATYYDVYQDGVRIQAGVTGNSLNVTGLAPETIYNFTVTSANANGVLAESSPVVVKTLAQDHAGIALTASPASIIGDGKSTSQLTAVVTDSSGDPVPNVEVVFTAPEGTFVDTGAATTTATTNGQGIAVTTYKSAVMNGTVAQEIAIKAVVNDTNKRLSGEEEIAITFMPATISGVMTAGSSNEPIANSTVTVTLDMDGDGVIEQGVDFIGTVVTDSNGAYSLPVPKGDAEYTLSVTRKVTVNGSSTEVPFTQKAKVGAISGAGEQFDSEKTVAGIVLAKRPDGQTGLLDSAYAGKLHVYLKDASGNYISENGKPKAFEVGSNGVFLAEGLDVGDYALEVRYEVASGVELTLSTGAVKVTASGEMNITEELIDPYGTITDAVTGGAIEGAKVTLHYANTENNRNKGIAPDTVVSLPAIAGFDPNDNANPQLSDKNGSYAFMVYPDTDYYLIVEKSGYLTYTSPVISVKQEIVRHDLKLTPNSPSSGVSSGSTSAAVQPDIAVNLSTDTNIVAAGGQSDVTVKYSNLSSSASATGEVIVILPAGVEIVDANGGTVSGNTIKWEIGDLAAGQAGSFVITLKWPTVQSAETPFNVVGEFVLKDGQDKAKSTLNIVVSSTGYGELRHQRYILGYPDGEFKPKRTLSRSELAAIVARLTENERQDTPIGFKDVSESHWAANYIKIAVKHGYFSGYQDGTFHPDQPVTRGELAVVMARFLGLGQIVPVEFHFSDVKGHWAANAIEELYRGKFVAGYTDGTFKPGNDITRDEAVTMINRMLYRGPLIGLAPQWPDIPQSYWAFGDIQEATISHESTRNEDGSETWVQSIEDDVQ